jgi:hypothetical protein
MIRVQRLSLTRGLLLSIPGLLICLLSGYVALSTGLVDDIYLARVRPRMLGQVEMASNRNPPDVESLVSALGRPDWFVAAIAAERLGFLGQSGELEPEQVDTVLQSLFEALSSDGHWWRFGWDRDEPEFEQFRGAAIEAVAGFGPEAIPLLLVAIDSQSPLEREDACWIALDMLRSDLVDQAALADPDFVVHVAGLARSDSNEWVRAACTSATNEMISQSP